MVYLECSYVVPKVLNTAVQVLLFLLGLQPMTPTPTKAAHFKRNGDAHIQNCASDLGRTPDEFAKLAHELIDGGNGLQHYSSREALEAAVVEASSAVVAFPEIRKYTFAVEIIENFSKIKPHLPAEGEEEEVLPYKTNNMICISNEM